MECHGKCHGKCHGTARAPGQWEGRYEARVLANEGFVLFTGPESVWEDPLSGIRIGIVEFVVNLFGRYSTRNTTAGSGGEGERRVDAVDAVNAVSAVDARWITKDLEMNGNSCDYPSNSLVEIFEDEEKS